jgi:hypothetical protein
VITPYEVAFQGFSSELGAVLVGLASLPHCFMVTNIVVEPASTATTPTDEQQAAPMDLYARYGLRGPMADQANLMRRYGLAGRYGSRYAPTPQPQPVAPRPVSRGPVNILDEKPLRFTLSIQAVKLKPTRK